MGKGYYYFETPDYDNCAGKVLWASKYALAFSVGWSVTDIVLSEKPRTLVFVANRLNRFVSPWMSTVILGSSLSCALSNMRGKKDDAWNYFWGGAASGFIWTHHFKCSGRGAAMGLLLGFTAAMAKQAHQNDWVIVTDHVEGNTAFTGAHGHENWGDLRIPGLIWDDPGRRPL